MAQPNPSIILEVQRDQSAAHRLWSKVERTPGCWNWKGAVGQNGYGHFWLNGRYISPHRVAYILEKGQISDNSTIDHLCRNRLCVNPSHLEAVLIRENVLRGEGPSALNSRKTHCPRGHPLEEWNLVRY